MSDKQTRGSLLRDINRLSTDIINLTERAKVASERLAAESATKADLVDKIAAAESEYTAVEKQKAAESANDSELVGLQRAVAALTLRRQELIKATKAARAQRDDAREEAVLLHYQRAGLQLEASIAAHSSSGSGSVQFSGKAVVWSPEASALLADAESMWKRASNQSTITRDLVEVALRNAGLRFTAAESPAAPAAADSEANDGSTGPATGKPAPVLGRDSGTASLVTGVGLPTLLSDTRKGLATLQDLSEAVASARSRAGALSAGADTDDVLSPDSDGHGAAAGAVEALLEAVRSNVHSQRTLLSAVERYLAGLVSPADDEDADGTTGGRQQARARGEASTVHQNGKKKSIADELAEDEGLE